MTVGVTVHDKITNLRQRGAGSRKLRHELRARFGTICCQEGINDSKVGGMVEFKFKGCYKTLRASHEATLGCFRFEQLQSIECRALLPPLSMRQNISRVNTMTTTRPRVRFIEDTTGEATEPHMVHEGRGDVVVAPKVPKSPQTP